MTEATIFAAALDRTNPTDRAAFLADACAGDDRLRRRVEALLKAHAEPDEILDAPPRSSATADYAPITERPGSMIGPYKLKEQIGEGGFGLVFVAEQQEPVKRKVALKVIKPGMDTREIMARFTAERQALALMDHPNIARVLDAGATDSGRPYFVMELVRGIPITDYCDQNQLAPCDRLDLFVTVCQAVQHAHQKGIIHRDIKPSNVLVTSHDGKPVAKVIDFGVAKAIHQQLTERSIYTNFAQMIGTPLYMSPEQAEMSGLDIDTRSDIYSLGVLLYELLTGTTPLEKKRFAKAAYDEIRRMIRDEEPPKPSTRLSASDSSASIAAQRHMDPARLSKLMRGDLDWIVMKALEKDRTRRYETANGFAADVQRYLTGEPVTAAPPSARYVLGKFIRRHKGQVIAAGLVLLVLLVGIAGTTWGLIEAKKQEGLAIAAHGEEILARQREARRADAEAKQRKRADDEKQRAVRYRDQALDALRATTGTDVEKLIGSKTELSAKEREYLEAIALRWQGFAKLSGDDVEAREYQIEGHFRVAYLWRKLGRRDEAQAEFLVAVQLQKKLAEQFPDKPDYQRDLSATRNNLGNLLKDRGQVQEAQAEYLAARDLLTKLIEQFPTTPEYRRDLAGTRNHLGVLLMGLGKQEEARSEYESARDLQKALVTMFPPVASYRADLARTQNNLGMLLQTLGKREEALAEYQSARDLQTQLVRQFPSMPEYRSSQAGTFGNLGTLLAEFGKSDEARAAYLSALGMQTKLVEQFPAVTDFRESLAMTHFNLGNLFSELGLSEKARSEFQVARDLRQKLVTQFPAMPDYLRNLAETRMNLGNALKTLGRTEEARTEYRSARDLRQKLVEQLPSVPEYQHALASSEDSLGILLADLGTPEEARAEYRAARGLLRKLVEQHPTIPEYRQDLADTSDNLGNLLTNLRKWDEARAEYLAAVDLQKKLVEQFPAIANYQIELGGSYCDYGILVMREGKPTECLEWFDRAIQILQPVHETEPKNAQATQFLRNSYWSRAQAYNTLHRTVEALHDWDQTIALSPSVEQIGLRASRAILRHRAGMAAEAIADVSELTKSENWTSSNWYDFACIYSVASGTLADKRQEYAERAVELLRKAVKAGWKDTSHLKEDRDLDPLRDRDDFNKLQTELETRSHSGSQAK